MQLFITMCERGLVAEGTTCLALISTCAKARQWQLSEEILLCTFSDKVASELLRKVGVPDASRMIENDRELLVRLQNWRHSQEAGCAPERSTPLDTSAAPRFAFARATTASPTTRAHSRSSTPAAGVLFRTPASEVRLL